MNSKTLERLLIRRNLARFASAMSPAFELAPHTRLMIEYLEKLVSGRIKKLALVLPPRHGKTLLSSMLLPAYVLGRDPTENVLVVSYGSDLSESWGRRTRNILNDPAFQQIFPACKISPDSAAVYRFETVQGGSAVFTGRGGPITGRGASLLILDDLVKDQSEANSDATCRSIQEWLEAVCFTRLAPNGRVLAIGTRWGEKDAMGFLMRQAGWAILHLPAIARENDPLGRPPGAALWPSHYDIQALEEIRRTIGSRAFACLYEGDPTTALGAVFRRSWFRHFQAPPEKFTRIIQSWDTSFKTGRENDYSVCATFGETQSGFYLLSLYRAKVEFPELKRKVSELADLWRPSEVLIEDRASGQSLVQELKTATSYPVIAIKADRDKETRASAVTGYFESGRVLFPEGAAWLNDLEDELASFPGGLHDDCVDSITQALNRLRGSSQGELGLVQWLKERGAAWLARPKPAAVAPALPAQRPRVTWQPPPEELPNCSICKTRLQRFGSTPPNDLRCPQCGGVYNRAGELVSQPETNNVCPNGPYKGAPHSMSQYAGGRARCQNCGYQPADPTHTPTNGMSRAQWFARRGAGRLVQ